MLNKASRNINGIEFVKLDDDHKPEWNKYLDCANELATPFHYHKWKDIISDNYNFEPYYYMLMISRKIVGVLPMFLVNNLRGKKLVSLPVSSYGGPVIDDPNYMNEILLFVKSFELEYHIFTKYNIEVFSCIVKKTDSIDYYSDHTTKEGFYKLIQTSSKVRNTILRCENDNIEFLIGKNEFKNDFYKLLISTRKRQNSFIPSMSFFDELFNSELDVIIFICRHNQLSLSAVLAIKYRNKLFSIYNPSNALSFEKRANEYLHAKLIDWSYSNNFNFYFGGTINCPSFKGLHDFKKKWNVKREEIYEYTNQEVFYVNEFKRKGIKMARFIPDCIYTRIGKLIIKYLY